MYYGIINSMNRVVPSNPLWNNLVAYYTGDNVSNDAKGVYNGTLINGTTYATGKINNGFSLDGVNDYISISPVMGDSVSGPSTSHTYSAWIYPTNVTDSYNVIFQNGGATNGDVLALRFNKVGYLYHGGDYLVTSTGTVNVNTWSHILITYSGANVSFYVNGVFNNTVATPFWAEFGAYGYTSIGAFTNSSLFFNGTIDEVAIWNRVLTSTEITELYNSGSGKQYPL
jgi:hypothetical protein